MERVTHVSPYPNAQVVHVIRTVRGPDGKPRTCYCHPDKKLGDPKWYAGKVVLR